MCVGFNVGNLAKGIIYAGRPDNIKVISKESKIVASIMESIIIKFNKKYGFDFYNKLANKGFWRIVLYRESK